MSSRLVFFQRKERLLAILPFMRSRGLVRASKLATEFGVTTRTVYRDINTLIEAGAPIEGSPGVGYMMGPHRRVPLRLTIPTPIPEILA